MQDILKSLKFVKGAVASKDFVPELTHFCIKNGYITGYNGKVGLRCPINSPIDATPKADKFYRAIEACNDVTTMSKTKTGRLSIKSGKFKTHIQCIEDQAYPEIFPEGEFVDCEEIQAVVKELSPFISEDASRPWSRGILFIGDKAYATNNIILVEKTLKHPVSQPFNIPKGAVKELIRIKEEPLKIQISKNSVAFHFEGDRWLWAQLYSLNWPNVLQFFDNFPETLNEIPSNLYEDLGKLVNFADSMHRLFFKPGKIATHFVDEEGASIDADYIDFDGCFNIKQFINTGLVATHGDFSHYPKPCPFTGNDIRGFIMGVRK
jgi:DNA polymerase III sliding clamp (beta) subunit (PCNA family)